MHRLFALLAILFFSATSAAQPTSGQVQPDRLDFGTVYRGALLEGSFLVYEAGTDTNIKFEIDAPPTIQIIQKSKDTNQYGPGKDLVRGTVELAIMTNQVGEFKEEVKVTMGKTQFKISIQASIKPARYGLKRILIAESALNCYATSHAEDLNNWRTLANQAFLDVSYVNVSRDKSVLRDIDLKKYDSVLLAGTGLYYLNQDDIKRVKTYVEGGGSLVLAANYFFRGTVKSANDVLADTGMEFQDIEARHPDVQRVTLGIKDIDAELQLFGVKSLEFFRGSPIAITDKGKAKVLVKTYGVGQPEDGFVVMTKVGKGRILALGTSLWWHWITPGEAGGTDNAKLLEWLLVSK